MAVDPDPLTPVREELIIEGGRRLWSYTFPTENESDEPDHDSKPEPESR